MQTALIPIAGNAPNVATPPSSFVVQRRSHGNRLLDEIEELSLVDAIKRLNRPTLADVRRIAAMNLAANTANNTSRITGHAIC